jgi:hypothetical protein
MTPLMEIKVVHEDGFVDYVRVRSETIARALEVAKNDDSYRNIHGEVVLASFNQYVEESEGAAHS